MVKEPIFIVGAPRSGTTLLTAFLSAHPNLDAGPETQFYNKLAIRKDKINDAINSPNWANQAADLLLDLKLAGQQVSELFGLERESIVDYLVTKDRNTRSMLEAFTESHALKNKKSRWIEKTPNHILHVNEIRKDFPYAPIIRITRDPRDSAVSICQLPWASDSAIVNSLLVNDWYTKSFDFFESDRNTITVRYEDLVENNELTLRRICSFIDEEYTTQMLNRSDSGKTVGSKNEPWKKEVSSALNTSRCYVWKSKVENNCVYDCIASICLQTIKKFDYENGKEQKKSVYLLKAKSNKCNDIDGGVAGRLLDGSYYLSSSLVNSQVCLVTWNKKLMSDIRLLLKITKLKMLRKKTFLVCNHQAGFGSLISKLFFALV